MKLKLNTQLVAPFIQLMMRMSAKSKLAVLKHALIRRRNGVTSLTVSHLDAELELSLPSDAPPRASEFGRQLLIKRWARENGTFLMPLDQLRDLAKKNAIIELTPISKRSPGEKPKDPPNVTYEIFLTGQTRGGIEISKTIAGLDVDEFPDPMLPEPTFQPVPENVHESIRRAFEFSSNDDTRQVLMGIFFSKDGYVVGTDGRRMVMSKFGHLPLSDTIIPNHPVLQSKEMNGPWRIASGKDKMENEVVSVKCGQLRFTTRIVDGNYPNFLQVLPSGKPTYAGAFEEPVEEIAKKMLQLPVKDRLNHPIKLRLCEHHIVFLGDGGHFCAAFKRSVGPKKPLEIGVNREFLKTLFQWGMNRVAFRFEDGIPGPITLSDPMSEAIIMPLRT